jgi:hypothetical protein
MKKLNQFIKNILINNNLSLSRFDKNKVKIFLEKIKIIDSGHKLIRIGANTDGGYLIPNILDQIEYCFSPGVGKSVTFEDHLLKYNIKSFLADGTVNYNGNHDFTKKNLNIFNDDKNITLEDWINEKLPPLDNKLNNKLLLQMDIEGCEIEILYNVSLECLDRFKIILIEFHHFNEIFKSVGLKIYNDLFDKILKTHNIVHIHPNNYSNTINFFNNKISELYEITFINKKDCKYIKKIDYNLPHKLDHRCDPSLIDVKCPEIFYKYKVK